MKYQVQEVGNPSNISMTCSREECDEYCAKANQIMTDHNETARFEVVQMPEPQALAAGQPKRKRLSVNKI